MITSVDVGYLYTKTDLGVLFESKITEDDVLSDGIKVNYNNKNYLVGTGRGTIETNKINEEVTELCLLTAISKSIEYSKKHNDHDIFLSTGLPIGQYQAQRDAFKERFINNYKINIDGKEQKINIKDVAVFPQGAGALYAYQIETDAIIVDIGGYTVDIAHFVVNGNIRTLNRYTTLYKGMITLYSKIIDLINKKYNLSLEKTYGEKILRDGLEIYGEPQDLSWLQPIYNTHVDEIVSELMLNYPYKTTPIFLCGGGAIMLNGAFSKRISNILVLEDSQFSNVYGFQRLGEMQWQKD